MLYLILWILCGVVAAAIYSNKGRSAVSAFLVGVLFGPIGVILALATPADKVSQERKAISDGSQKKCPQCAELVKAEANLCRFCGHEFAPRAQLESGQVAKIIKGDAVRCSACNGAVRAESTLCKHCKKQFTVEQPILA